MPDTLRKRVLDRVRDNLRDGMPGVTVTRMAFARLPEASLPVVAVIAGVETSPLPGEHDDPGFANRRMHVGVALYARARGVSVADDEGLADDLEDLRGLVVAAIAGDPPDGTLGGLVQWIVDSGSEPMVPATGEAAVATAAWLLNFTALRPEAELDAYHPTAA